MPGIDACDPDGSDAARCAPDGWVAGVLLAVGVGVAPSPGESTDRMPGIDGCEPDTAEPDACPADECAAGVWLAAPLGAAAWPWPAVGESNRYKLYSRI